ncbi:MAG TPA: O-antigen ligase family protein [Pseudonocardiaceae bacterium]|nr:O-antigen ligase family protein [Pseudonocardiaceae bacterium]
MTDRPSALQQFMALGRASRQAVTLGGIGFAIALLSGLIFTPYAILPFALLIVVAAIVLSRSDEVTAISVLIGAVALIPANRVIAPLGAVGVPGIVTGGGLLLLWVYSRCGPRMGTDRGRQPVRVVAYLLLVSTVASYVAGQVRGLVPVEESPSNAALLILASGMGILLFTSDAVRDMERLMKVIEILVAGAAFMAAVALLQYYNIFDFATSANFPGLVLNTTFSENVFVIERAGLNRVAGTATHPIELSVVLSMALPLALNMALFGPRAKRAQNWVMCGLIASIIPLTVSRSGILAVGAALLVYTLTLKFRTILSLMPLAFFGVAGMVILAPGVLGTLRGFLLDTGTEPSSTARTDDYPVVYAQWQEHPLLGRGPGTYLPKLYTVLDNQYLLTLVSTGVLGLLVYIVLLCTGYSLGRRVRRLTCDEEQRQLGQALAASLVAAMVSSFTFDAMSFTVMFVVTNLIVGLTGALWRIAVRDGEVPTGAAHAGTKRSPNAAGHQASLRAAGTGPEGGAQG